MSSTLSRIVSNCIITISKTTRANKKFAAFSLAMIAVLNLAVFSSAAQPEQSSTALEPSTSRLAVASFSNTVYSFLQFLGLSSQDDTENSRGEGQPSPYIEPEIELANLKDLPEPETMASALPCSLSANPIINVPSGPNSYPTIQQAINAADPAGGDRIQVAAGTYTQQLVIDKCVFITGAGQNTTIIQSPAVLATSSVGLVGVNRASIVEVTSNSAISMSDLTVAGPVPFTAPGVSGIFVIGNAALKLTNVRVTAIRQMSGITGDQKGNAIVAGSTAYNQIGALDLNNVTVDDYQKTGILVDRIGSTLSMTGTTVTGVGSTPTIAQNGVQIGRRASGTITNSSISNNDYLPTSTVSVGVLAFNNEAVTVTGTTMTGNDQGINSYLFTTDPVGSPIPVAPSLSATSNTFVNNSVGGLLFETAATIASDNVITGSRIGIRGRPINGQTATLVRNSITAPVGVGSVGIDIDDRTGGSTTTATVTANYNRIYGHTNGLINDSGSSVNAEFNWWGCNAGPGLPGCDPVTGSGTTDFDPWVVLTASADPGAIIPGATKGVSTNLSKDSSGGTLAQAIPSTPVNFSATNGSMSPSSGTLASNLPAASTFTSTNADDAVATVNVDGESINLPITVDAPQFTINSVTQPEGSPTGTTAFDFTVTKTGATLLSSDVLVTATNGTATAPTDFAVASLTKTFPATNTTDTQTFTVLVNKDSLFEGNETFTAVLAAPTNGELGIPSTGIGTIQDDDAITASINPTSSANEGSNVTFTVTLSNPSATNTTINYAFADVSTSLTDRTAPSGSLVINAGLTTGMISVPALPDNLLESPETFTITLTSASGATIAGSPDNLGTGTILDTDVAIVYVNDDWVGTTPGADPGPGPGNNFGVDAFATVQSGVDGVAVGGTVIVYDGTYVEQVIIDKNLTMDGESVAGTIIKVPSSSASLPANSVGDVVIVNINNGATVTMQDLTVTGTFDYPGCGGPYFDGIYVLGGATLNLTNAAVSNIKQSNPAHFGCQNGFALSVGAGFAMQAGTANVTNVTFDDYQKEAMYVDGSGSSVNVQNSTFNGEGPTNTAQNIFQISDGATAIINGSNIGTAGAGSQCNVPSNPLPNPGCGSTPDQYQGSGVLLYNAGAVSITNSNFTDNDNAISAGGSNGDLTLTGNTFVGNRYYGLFLSEGTTNATNNTFSGPMNTGVSVYSGAADSSNASLIFNNNTITGAATGLQLLKEVVVFAPNSNETEKGDRSQLVRARVGKKTDATTVNGGGGGVPSITGSYNRIVSSSRSIDNPQDNSASLANNWWGCNAGPGAAACGIVTGTNAVYAPWAVLTTSATPTSVLPNGTSTLSADLSKDNLGNSLATPIPAAPVAYTSGSGSMSPPSGSIANNLISWSTFTAANTLVVGNQIETISATVDNQTESENITILDLTPPTVTILKGIDPDNASPVTFTVTFSEPVTGFDSSSDITIGGTAFGPFSAPMATITGGTSVYTVSITGMNQSGTVTASVGANKAIDTASNPNTPSNTDQSVQFNQPASTTVLVTPSTAPGLFWGYYNDSTNSPIVGYDFVFGPDNLNAPLPIGSARLKSASLLAFGTTVYNGTKLADFTELSYSTYVKSGSTGDVPTLQFNADFDGVDDAVYQGRVVFVPSQNPPPTPAFDTWQSWNATNGKFWTSYPTVLGNPSVCTMALPCTRVDFLAAYPGVRVHPTFGALLFRTELGSDSNVDKLTVGVNSVNTIYNFEPSTPSTNLAYAGVTNPTNENPLLFTVTFSEPVAGFDGSDISFAGTSTGGTPVATVTGGPTSYNVSVTGMTGVGNVVVGVPAAAATGLNSGVPSTASVPVTVSVNYDGAVPTVTINQGGSQTDPTNISPIIFDVVFSETVTGFATGDVQFTGSTAGGALIGTVTGTGPTYNVAVTGMTTPGTVVATIPSGVAFDAVDNGNAASTFTDNTVNWVGGATTLVVDKDGFATAADCDDPTPNTAFVTIQSAIDAASSGNTIKVCPGTYAEELNINKPLTLLGPNDTINPNTGARTDEAIIVPTFSDPINPGFGGPLVVYLATSGITFKGFTVDGDNPLVSGGLLFNGADVNAEFGIYGPETANPDAVISNNIVQNIGEMGVWITSNSQGGAKNANSSISNNKVDNILGNYGQGIRIGEDAWVSITGNKVSRVRNGIVVENFSGNTGAHPASVIDSNEISSFRRGIRHNLHYTYAGPGFTLSNNTITPYVQSVFPSPLTGSAEYYGIMVESVQQSVAVTVSNNVLTGNRVAMASGGYTRNEGLIVTNSSTASPNIAFTGNRVSDFVRGVFNEDTPSVPTFTCNEIYGNTTGIFVSAGAANGLIANSNDIVGNDFGVQNNGPTLLNATGNYWGSVSGAGPVNTGLGDRVSTNVNFSSPSVGPNGCTPTVTYVPVTINKAVLPQTDPTAVSPINFTVEFDEPVTGFTAADIKLSGTAGANLAVVSGSGATYNVAVSGMANSGTVIAEVYSGGGVSGSGIPSVASASTDNSVDYDITFPTVVSINLAGSTPTNASSVTFTVTFSEDVTGVDPTDFVPVMGGGLSGASVTGVSGSGSSYNVTVNTGSGSGTLGLNLVDDNSIVDTSTNPLGGAAAGDGNFTGQVYTIDKAAPTVSVTGVTSSPTNNPTITFLVDFNEVMNGFDATDLSGSVGNGTVASFLNNNDTTYTVTVTATTDGAVTLFVPANSGNDPAGNGNVISNTASVTYDSTAPTVTVVGSPDPDNDGSPVTFTATFSETVTGFDASDVVVAGTAFTAGTPVVTIGGVGPIYSISVTGMNQSGTVIASIAGSTVADLAGNPNSANTGDNNVQFNLINTNVVVSSATMNGWGTVSQRTASGGFVTGPGTPPLSSVGGWRTTTGAGNSGPDLPQGGAGTGGKNWLTTQQFDNVKLSEITSLSYSTYVPASSPTTNVTHSLQLQIDLDGDGNRDRAMIFEPVYSPAQGSITTGTWQTWNARAGNWWFSGAPTVFGASQTVFPSFNAILAAYPNAKIVTWFPLTDGYGTQFQAGMNSAGAPWTNFEGNIDNFVFGVSSSNTTFDFEPAPPTLSVANASGPEGGTASFAVTLTGDTLSRTLPVTVRLQTSDGTATLAGSDYVAVDQIVTFAPGTSSVNVPVTLNSDMIAEGTETFTVTLSEAVNAGLGGTPATGTIVDSNAFVAIGGQITSYPSGPGIAGVTVTLSGSAAGTTLTDANGFYNFNTGISVVGEYVVTPTCVSPCVGFIFDPQYREFINPPSNVTNADFIGYNGNNPREIRIVDTAQTTVGANVVVPIRLVAQGNENAVNFTMNYNVAKLQYVSVTCGPTPGCSATADPGGNNFVIEVPSSNFPAGTVIMANVTFTATPGPDVNTPVTFSAAPGTRKVSNIQGAPLPTNWVNGTVTFARGLEGDITNAQPGGGGLTDGFVDASDFARLRNLILNPGIRNLNVNEFQRADIANYSDRGDGFIDASDVSVMRRYINGDLFATRNAAAGQNGPGAFAEFPTDTKESKKDANLVTGDLRVLGAYAQPNSNVTVAIEIDSRSQENAISFTLQYDDTKLENPVATLGPDNTGVNPNPPNNSVFANVNGVVHPGGKLAVLWEVPNARLTPSVTKHIINVTFHVKASAPFGLTPLSFNSTIANQKVSDIDGVGLATNWIGNNINIIATPTSSNVNVAAHVSNAAGTSVKGAIVRLTATTGEVYVGTSNGLGNVIVPNVPAGATYVLTVSAKGYTFTPRAISVDDNISKLDLTLDQ